MYSNRKKTTERRVADKLVKQHEQNEKLREKIISDNFWKYFKK